MRVFTNLHVYRSIKFDLGFIFVLLCFTLSLKVKAVLCYVDLGILQKMS